MWLLSNEGAGIKTGSYASRICCVCMRNSRGAAAHRVWILWKPKSKNPTTPILPRCTSSLVQREASCTSLTPHPSPVFSPSFRLRKGYIMSLSVVGFWREAASCGVNICYISSAFAPNRTIPGGCFRFATYCLSLCDSSR